MTTAGAPVMADRNAAVSHLDMLVGLCFEPIHLYLWTWPAKRSHWFTPDEIEQAADRAMSLAAAGQNVYVGGGLGREAGGDYERITNEAAAGLVGLPQPL